MRVNRFRQGYAATDFSFEGWCCLTGHGTIEAAARHGSEIIEEREIDRWRREEPEALVGYEGGDGSGSGSIPTRQRRSRWAGDR